MPALDVSAIFQTQKPNDSIVSKKASAFVVRSERFGKKEGRKISKASLQKRSHLAQTFFVRRVRLSIAGTRSTVNFAKTDRKLRQYFREILTRL